MSLYIEKIYEKTATKNWMLLNYWKLKKEIDVFEVIAKYNDEQFQVIFPSNYQKRKMPITIYNQSQNTIYNKKIQTINGQELIENLESILIKLN